MQETSSLTQKQYFQKAHINQENAHLIGFATFALFVATVVAAPTIESP
jgi:hypothetical protein